MADPTSGATPGPTVSELFEALQGELGKLEDAASWQAFLRAQARFHRYSYANTLLILRQRPAASAVAGFATWRALGRSVRRGERAIWIVAPVFERRGPAAERRVVGFRRVAVFDVSQTDGAELTVCCSPLQGADPPGLFARLVEVAQALGFAVELADLEPGCYGDCTYGLRRIRVSRSASGAQAAKTLAHELAHACLHEHAPDRALAELEAESVAYICCQVMGLDTGQYSFGYLATWAGGTAEAQSALRTSCRRIASTAERLLGLLESSDEVPDPS